MKFSKGLAILIATATTAGASIAPSSPSHDRDVRIPTPATGNPTVQEALTHGSDAWQRFTSEYGGRWNVTWDERSGRAYAIQGSGAQLMASDARDARRLERAARSFLGRHGELFGVATSDLELRSGSGFHGRDGEIAYAHFGQLHDGVPVAGSRVYLRFKHGRLLQTESHTFSGIELDVQPSFTADEAAGVAVADVERAATSASAETSPRLIVLPQDRAGATEFRLAWKLDVVADSPFGRWTYFVDAHTASVIARRNRVHHSSDGTVTAQVVPLLPTDPLITVPLEGIEVTVDGQTVLTDADGSYASGLTGAPTRSAALSGSRVFVNNRRGDEAQVTETGSGTIDLAFDTSNARVDEMTTYYWTTQINDEARRWLDLPWLDTQLQANVNFGFFCNAFWDGRTINFFQEGGGCANTGELPDVVGHEWGHGLDDNDGNGITDGAFSEGFGDVLGMVLTGSCALGDGFIIGGDPLRDNCVPCKASECTTPEPHRTGQIYASAMWCTREALIDDLGEEAGLDKWKELVFTPLPTITAMASAYPAMLLVDDDDADLSNGTPNLCAINGCFTEVELTTADPACAAQASVTTAVSCEAGPFTRPSRIPVELSAGNLADSAATVQTVVDVIDAAGVARNVLDRELTLDGGETREGTLRLPARESVAPGPYTVRSQVLVDGEVLAESSCEFELQ